MIIWKPFQSIYQNINNLNWSVQVGQRLQDSLNIISNYLQQIIEAANNPTSDNMYGTAAQMSRLDAATVPNGALFWQTDTLHMFQAQKQITTAMKWIQII